MSEYQAIARKYRPKRFRDVLGQGAIVQTLMNALKKGRLAHAYLFCGTQGTGKTTLARLLAKAINCEAPMSDHEPCNVCSSCKEIAASCAVDVLEIDGASHRGIEDVRQINETIGYAPSRGKCKIYLIDEVHMLTKEAFNALLKTLEEPPEKVKFFFATTEPHKIPETILSRCQRFNLHRIPDALIQTKLSEIARDLQVEATDEALHILAERSGGSLRDAESLLDQVIGFGETCITPAVVENVLGLVPKERLFALSEAGPRCDYKLALDLASEIFNSGRSLAYFLEELLSHFRTMLLLKIGGDLSLPPQLRKKFETYLPLYTTEQCLEILEMIKESESTLKFALSHQIFLEMLLLRILRTHQMVTLDALVDRLSALEQNRPLEAPKPAPEAVSKPSEPAPEAPKAVPIQSEPKAHQSHYDTLMRFAAKELGGSLKTE